MDPIDGTTPTSLGRGGALAVIAVSERGTMFNPGPCVYMEKLAVGPKAAGSVDIRRSPTDNLDAVSKALGKSVQDLTVVILDRPRHADLIAEVRAERGPHPAHHRRRRGRRHLDRRGPRPGTDILFGIGGTPEGVIAAAALKSMGGEIQGRLWPRDEDERASRRGRRLRPRRACSPPTTWSRSDNCFFAATGITDGELLHGVRYHDFGATTQSLVMRSRSGTVRLVSARHPLDKLREFSQIEFG